MGNTKKTNVKEVKEPVVFTRKQIAWATTKFLLVLVTGIVIGVLATNAINSTVDAGVASKVSQLKVSQ